MTWFDMGANTSTMASTASTNLIIHNIPLTASNTITLNGTQFFNQPIQMFNMAEQVHDGETEYQKLIRLQPEYRKHRLPPDPLNDWDRWNRRRRKGEKCLVQMMDVCDRLQWFDSKSICLQYPNVSSRDYSNRILLIHPMGKFEFNSNGTLLNKRNIWISTHEDRWSYEDMCLTMVFHFQLNPTRFVYEIGCRDSVYSDEHKTIGKDFKYGYELRLRAKEREKFQNLCNPFMENRKLPD